MRERQEYLMVRSLYLLELAAYYTCIRSLPDGRK